MTEKGRSGKKWWLPAAVMIVLVAVIAAVVICLRPDNVSALTAEEKAIRSFETAVNPDRLTVERLYELQRMLRDVRTLPRQERRAMLVRATCGGIDRTLQNFGELPAERKEARARQLADDAVRMRRAFLALPREKQRDALRLLHDDPEAKATMSAAIDTFFYRLSAEDRALLAPTVTEWKKLLEMK